MRVGENLGQLRMAGKVPYMYDMYSARPYPYKSEAELIDEGLETNLVPIWGNMPWPKFVPPPPVPSQEAEVYQIRRAENGTIYPWAGTWNYSRLPSKELDKTSYPMGPPMDGLGQAAMPFALTGVAALLMAPILGGLSYASFRAIGNEPKTLWKVALGAGGVIFGLHALGFVMGGLGSLALATVPQQGK